MEDFKLEFKQLKDNFPSLFEKTKAVATKELLSVHDLYEIEPFFMEIKNQIPTEVSFLTDINDYDPKKNDLYLYHVKMDTKKILFKRLVLADSSYDTIYEYTDEYFKSSTIFMKDGVASSMALAYLFFKEKMPYQYLEITQYGISVKDYKFQEKFITGYKQNYTAHDSEVIKHSEVNFYYDDKPEIYKIDQIQPNGQLHVLYKKFSSNENVEKILKKIEDYLVDEITRQISSNIKIADPVYTVLLEYSSQPFFPPTLAIGMESERLTSHESNPLGIYNAPDMFYFSEKKTNEPGYIKIDLYDYDIQEYYLFIETENKKLTSEANLQDVIYKTYLNVAKRLMKSDFSKSFCATADFLVMARDFEACNEERFYNDLKR